MKCRHVSPSASTKGVDRRDSIPCAISPDVMTPLNHSGWKPMGSSLPSVVSDPASVPAPYSAEVANNRTNRVLASNGDGK